MKPSFKSLLMIFLALFALTFSTFGTAPARAADNKQSGLSAGEWEQIQAMLPAASVPNGQQAYFKASNSGASDHFGFSIAMSGDTLVVGALHEDSNASGVNGNQANNSAVESGAAYVFIRNGAGTWSQQAYLKASNTEAWDNFGYSVAISGDTLVVGATGEASNATGVNGSQADNSAPNAGAVYVFTRSGTTWSQQAYLKASNTGTGDWFGYSVATTGDTVIVGANGESSNATGVNGSQSSNSAASSGAVYVFNRSGAPAVWSQQAYLKASNTGTNDNFGNSVALSGDTLVVGAVYESSNATGINGNQSDNSASQSGAVYVFNRSGTPAVWSQQAYLKASNTEAFDSFGISVAISGNTLVAGATHESSNATGVDGNQANNSASSSGAAYVFIRNGVTWSQQAYLKASNTELGDWFGNSVAISSDTLVVGAYQEDSNATGLNGNENNNSAAQSGAAYIFTRSGVTWGQQAYLKTSNTGAGDWFGYSVALSGNTLAAGAYYEDSNATTINGDETDNSAAQSGAAYVFNPAPEIGLKQGSTVIADGGSHDFGSQLLSSNTDIIFNIKNTGFDDLILTTPITVGGANADQFSVQTQPISPISASSSDTFTVRFTPTSAGAKTATISIANNDSNENPYDLVITGTGFAPEMDLKQGSTAIADGDIYDFGSQLLSSNTDIILSIENTGTDVLTFTTPITIGGANANQFSIQTQPISPVSASGSSTFTVRFTPTSIGAKIATIAIDNNDSNENPYDLTITGTGTITPEINVRGNTITIADGDSTPSAADHTDFGNVAVSGGSADRAFTVENLGIATLTLSGVPIVSISGANAADFSITAQPVNLVSVNGLTTFTVRFDPSAEGLRTAIVSFANNDSDENPYNFSIAGNGVVLPAPIFMDVPLSYWANSYIEKLYKAGVTGGCGINPLIYCPEGPVTRAQMAIFLLKGLHGANFTPPAIGASSGFSDVPTDYWAATWIKQLAVEGITSGCGNGKYCPEDSVTRAQMAVFLLKAMHSPAYTPPPATGFFTDVPIGYWADKWIEQLAAEGVTSGCGTGIYCPDAPTTRAQMAVFLVKTFNLP